MKIPEKIYPLGNHACFAYRVLEHSYIKDVDEILRTVIDLCGAGELSCPGWSSPAHPSPDESPAQSSFILPSPSRASAKSVFTSGDYVVSDEEDDVIAKLQRQTAEGSAQAGMSVRHNYSLSFMSLTTLGPHPLPQWQPRATKRLRPISFVPGEDVVPTLFHICIFQSTYQPHRQQLSTFPQR